MAFNHVPPHPRHQVAAGEPARDIAGARPVKGNRLAPVVLRSGDPGDPPGERRPRSRRFVLALLAAAALALLAMGCVNAVVDPLGTVGTGLLPTVTWSDRSTKAYLVQHLEEAPGILILGSSRAMKVEPAYLARKTGRSGFNAAVSSGRPLDAWAFTNLVHDSYPDAHTRYLWLLDVEAFREWPADPGLLNTPQLAAYLPTELRWRTRARQFGLLFSWSTGKLSLEALRKHLREGPPRSVGGSEFTSDGFRRLDYHDRLLAQGKGLAAELPKTIKQAVRTFGTEYTGLSADAKADFEKTLGFMNRLGQEPILVISPTHPNMLSCIAPLGWEARHRDVLDYLGSLERRHRFHVLDFAHISSFDGVATDFYDGYHMTVANTRRLVDEVLERLPGALR